MQHNFFYAKSLVHSWIITRKWSGLLVDSERVCALWGGCREKNLQRRWLIWGSRGRASSRRSQGCLLWRPPAFGDFYNFLMKLTRF